MNRRKNIRRALSSLAPAAAVTILFLSSALFLGWRAGEAGLGTAWIDPFVRMEAQDEGIYAVSTLHMARSGDWLTPRFMGRPALHKPPLLYWFSAGSVRMFGNSNLALRAPAILAAAATVTLAAVWAAQSGSWLIALSVALLLLSNRLFFSLSRLAMTDSLLVLETTAALFILHRDPRLERRWSTWLLGLFCGAALMTKAAAGALPILIVALSILISPVRPNLSSLARAAAATLAVALPWHALQLWLHPKWFWTEYVLHEHLMKGAGSPAQTTAESPVWFYAKRLLSDPILPVAALCGAWFRRPRLAIAWTVVVLAAAFSFRYRNISYVLPLIPALAILASGIPARFGKTMLAVAGLAIAVKIAMPGQAWGLPYAPQFRIESQERLRAYAARGRPQELIVVAPDDQFYAATLPLPSLRYCYLGEPRPNPEDPLDFRYLGIWVTVPEFQTLPQRMPEYAAHLREFGAESTAPVATALFAANAEQVREWIEVHPDTDFFLPREFAPEKPSVHAREDAGDRVFLLAR